MPVSGLVHFVNLLHTAPLFAFPIFSFGLTRTHDPIIVLHDITRINRKSSFLKTERWRLPIYSNQSTVPLAAQTTS